MIEVDVLVLGGGLAATCAASAAAQAGAAVVLADKGFCGTSGVTATAGPGHRWVPPAGREAAIRDREALGEGLAEQRWMARVLDETWRTLPTLAGYYTFPRDDTGAIQYRNMRGPEYMRAMRRLVLRSGVRVLDKRPALDLLLHTNGSVAGAAGIDRTTAARWTVRAGAVVLATGGCAFMSHLLGCHTNTGDGALMAAEAGAELSGMEFSAYYTVAPAFSTMTRSMSYAFAVYTDASGRELDVPAGRDAALARARSTGRRSGRVAEPIGAAGLRPRRPVLPTDTRAAVAAVQAEMLPPETMLFRAGPALLASYLRLDQRWSALRDHAQADDVGLLRSREAAAMTAYARWCLAAALARTESRGMHRRTDAPDRETRLAHRNTVGGLDGVWVRPDHLPVQAAA